MFIGLLCAIGACFLWGAIFVIPAYLPEFNAMEVALGRYFSYGLFSLVLMMRKGTHYFKKYSSPIWFKALTFGLIANICYYIGTVIALRFATPPITVIVVGLCPIAAAIYGNMVEREFSFKELVFPTFWTIVGILLVNFVEVDWTFKTSSPQEYLIGLIGALVALGTWSWFAVDNSRFLKRHPELKTAEWSTLLGVGTFFWVAILVPLLSWGPLKMIDLGKFTQFTPATYHFMIGGGLLGIVCAWVGGFLWNTASSKLPMSITGPLIIFETIFGLIFVFFHEKRFPSFLECIGIGAMLSGVLLCLNHLRKTKRAHI